ncbi:MAG: PTS sugar transporter subunit IIA [Gammaproteobacteria bacterium]|nr:PTS sugar transporter subunit IIA [Gammaproteobacteria bacterium]
MSVAVLIITHYEIGHALVNALRTTYGDSVPLILETFEVPSDADPDKLLPELNIIIKRLDQGNGVLILTDLFGSTPSNIAYELQKESHIRIVTGLNLPMLIRVMNYPSLSLADLAEKAMKGGQAGIIGSGDVLSD